MLERHRHQHPTRDFDGITDNRAAKIPKYFSALFFGLLLWGAGYMAYYLFSGWSQEGEFAREMAAYETARSQAEAPPTAAAAASSPEEVLARGADLYAKRCRSCHGSTGKGGVGTNLTLPTYHYGREPEAVAASIRDGRPRGMPAFGNQLPASDIQALTQFVLRLE